MAFLNKKETSLINMINASIMTSNEKAASILQVKNNARLRQDRFRKPVNLFLTVLSNHLNNRIAISCLE